MLQRTIAATDTSLENRLRESMLLEKPVLTGPSTLAVELAHHHGLLDTLHTEINSLSQMLQGVMFLSPVDGPNKATQVADNAPYVKEMVEMNISLNLAISRLREIQAALRL